MAATLSKTSRPLQVDGHRTVRAGVDGVVRDVLGRRGGEVDRAEDAAEVPPVGAALGAVDRVVGRLLVDGHLELVGGAVFQEPGDIIREAVETALVHGTGGLAVDAHVRVGHHALEDDAHVAAPPGGRDLEVVAVLAVFVDGSDAETGRKAVGVLAEALQLPLRWDFDRGPFAAVLSVRAAELPGPGVVGAGAGEIQCLRLLGRESEDRCAQQRQR